MTLRHPISHTGWRICIGCLRLQISFRKRAIKYRALLRKMTHKDKVSYASLPPCRHSRKWVVEPLHTWIWVTTLILGFFCGKWPMETRYDMGLCHTVDILESEFYRHCRSLSAKEPLILGLFCGKWHIKTRYPMHLCHPVDIRESEL